MANPSKPKGSGVAPRALHSPLDSRPPIPAELLTPEKELDKVVTAASSNPTARLKQASQLPGAPYLRSLEKAAKAFENFRLSRFAKDALPENYLERYSAKDAAAVQDKQRKLIKQQLEKLPQANSQNLGMTLSFASIELEAIKRALPGINVDGGEVELSDLLNYVRSRANGTTLYSRGNPVAKRLTTESRFRSQAQEIVAAIKARTHTATIGEPKTLHADRDAPLNPQGADTGEPKL